MKTCPFKKEITTFKMAYCSDGMPYPDETDIKYFMCTLRNDYYVNTYGEKISECIGEDKCPIMKR